MATKDLKLELKFSGSILDSQVSLEGNNIGLWNCHGQICTKELPNYQIDGPLDVVMISKGKNGATSTLTIKISGQDDEILTGTIENGKVRITKAIDIK